jgi:hypothetical protein
MELSSTGLAYKSKALGLILSTPPPQKERKKEKESQKRTQKRGEIRNNGSISISEGRCGK